MTSRLRGPSTVKDTPRTASFAKDQFHRGEPEAHSGRSCKNGGRGNRYHFGMSKQHDSKTERNGREYNKEEMGDNDADLLYKKSREHFGSWDIKDDTRRSSRRDLEDTQLMNGKFRSEPVSAKFLDKIQDRLEYRDEGYVGSLPRENRQKGESIERELNGSRRSRRKECWEESVESRNREKMCKISRNNDSNNDTMQPVDERDILLKEIESLAIDGSQSPDRRIQAMIERLKSREENKLRSRREQRSEVSPDKKAYDRAKSGRSDLRSPIIDHLLDNRSDDRNRKDDREDERRSSEYKLHGKSDREEDSGRRDRSTDRRSRSIERQKNEDREPRGDDTFRKRSDTCNTERNYRRKLKEDEEARSRDSLKRRSYTYEGSPEDFDVRIQRYDRVLLEPRRDLDRGSPRRSSPRESNLVKKESLKEFDQEPIVKKNSFRTESRRAINKDCGESSLTRKTLFKDQDNDVCKSHVLNSQHDTSIRYFGKDQEDLSHKNSFKDKHIDADRKAVYKVQELGKTFPKNQHDSTERKISSKEHTSGVSRIILRNFDDDLNRNNSLKNTSKDSDKKNEFKEKNVEFGKIFCKDRESDSERRKNSFKDDNEEFGQTSYHNYENDIDRKTANDRYIEFGKISFKTQQDDELRSSNSFMEEDDEAVVRTSSFKERDVSSKRRVSLRNRDREAFERKSNRHSKPLSPPKKDDPEDNAKELKNFCPRSWHESNRMFSAKYLQNHSKLRSTPEGRLDVDGFSPERGFSNPQNTRTGAIEASANDPEEDSRFESCDRNGATIIRIRSSEDDPDGVAERVRRRRRPVQEICLARRRRHDDNDEDSDENQEEEENRWRRTRGNGGILPGRDGGDAGSATPSRTIWNYREGVWHFHESIAFDRSFMVQRREAIFINRWRR